METIVDVFQSVMARKPFGQVPAAEDGDLKLFKSRAITRYIVHEYAKNGTPLIYDTVKKIVPLSIWLEVEAHRFNPPAYKLIWELVAKPNFGLAADPAIILENEAKLAEVLDIYEARLSQSKYLGGDSVTVVDLHHLPEIIYLMDTQVKKIFEACPHFFAWCTDILARPSWSKVLELHKDANY
ncbi:hypothetical protein GIB67_006864 [Kingdonia uniflora]|uniref:glutathione transferase n=1 Tax=Kingdonia uniflora TaxID=39325 RepID=A0A7J7L083_9MAGN|nr:hypothetical protein GIB67_006864 [Kingdonia uniflora]